MYRNLLGVGVGIALGAAIFAQPASASTFTINGGTEVGDIDTFIGMCAVGDLPGTLMEQEIACLNQEINVYLDDNGGGSVNFTQSDAEKVEDEDLNFTATDQRDDVFAQLLPKTGGWFAAKTGNISGDQWFLIFRNDFSSLYAVFGIPELEDATGLSFSGITKISHITVVPLPGAALLFGSALLGGGLMRRRKMIRKFGLPAA